ncbi:MAG: S-layer homology domain-containing protein [Moorellaceae bacterium]
MYRRREAARPWAALLIALMVFSLVVSGVGSKLEAGETVAELKNKAVDILYKDFTQNGPKNQDNGVGAYAAYVLTQAGVDVSDWFYQGQTLERAVTDLVYQDLKVASDPSQAPAKRLAQDLLAMKALGREVLVESLLQVFQTRQSPAGFDPGPYSLFSNLPAYDLLGRGGFLSVVDAVYAKEYILGAQNLAEGDNYGAWDASWPDFVSTAQAVRALAYLDPGKADAEIQAAVERGVQWLKKQQQPDGSFAVSSWDDPLIDTVEMIATLKVLGQDPAAVKSAAGNSPVDYMLTQAWNTKDGTSGFGAAHNIMDATWALYGYCLLGTQGEEGTTPSTPSGSSGTGAASCTVQIAVVGKSGELLYGPGSVTVLASNRWGLTVLGALDATGLSYTMSSKWPDLVESIAGQANSGMSGWMYQVNGSVGSVAAGQYPIGEGDKIIWWYSKDLSTPAPDWEELEQRLSSPRSTGTTKVQSILDELQKGLSSPAQALSGLMEIAGGLNKNEVTEELRKALGEVIGALQEKLVRLPGKALQIRIEADKAEIKIDAAAVKEQVESLKKAAELADKLQGLGLTEEAGRLRLDTFLVSLPAQAGSKGAVSVTLPAGALQAVAAGGWHLGLDTPACSLRLPPEVLKTLAEEAAGNAGIEWAVQKLDPARIQLFASARTVGEGIFDFQLNIVTPEGGKEKPQAGFARRITITLPLDDRLTGTVDKDKLAVYRQKEDGSWEYVGGTLSSDGQSFTFETEHLSVYALVEYGQTFRDLQGHWAKKDVELMARRLIARGLTEDLFGPEQEVTRAQAAAFLVRSLGLEEPNFDKGSFRDVPPQHWAFRSIEAAYRAGLVAGTGEGNFEPERTITREEMAALLVRALEKEGWKPAPGVPEDKNGEAVYTDSSSISSWARESVKLCVSAGLLRGRSATELVPQGQVTRAEAVVMLKRMLQMLGRIPSSS